VLCFCDLLITSILTLRTKMPQSWAKREKMWNTLNFHIKSKYRDICGGVKCQCCLWGLWLVNVACEVYVFLMLHARSKSLSMCQCYYLTMNMCPCCHNVFEVNVEVGIFVGVSLLQTIKIQCLWRIWLKLNAGLCKI
jgi:hypothetical protein